MSAVIVSQTLPFTNDTLSLADSSSSSTRWSTLFPLLRPSIISHRTPKNHLLLADTSKARGKQYMHIVPVATPGSFTSKLLDDKHITAIIADENRGAGVLTAGDLPTALQGVGIDVGPGVVLVKIGGNDAKGLTIDAPGVLDVEVRDDVEQDHVLHLLGTATGGTRANPHNMAEMIKNFFRGRKAVKSRFHGEKVDGKPAILHETGTKGFSSVGEAVERDVKTAMDSGIAKEIEKNGEGVTYSVHFSDVNGLSRLENYIVVGEIAKLLDAQGLKYCLSHSTIVDHDDLARGYAISVCPMPEHFLAASPKPQPHKPVGASATGKAELGKNLSPSQSKIIFDDKEIRRRIENGCNALIKEEPTITEYDTIVGDGDCGFTLRDGAKKVLEFISNKDLSRLPETVGDLVRELEIEMGGTSGALYCIYLTALANALATESSIPAALKGALNELCKYTNARVGDRTMMDALIPFIDTLESTSDSSQALQKAKEGVEGTKQMEAKLGRSTYLDESATKGVPDPGAYGLLVLFEGMSK